MMEIKTTMYEILKYEVGPIAGLDTDEKKNNWPTAFSGDAKENTMNGCACMIKKAAIHSGAN